MRKDRPPLFDFSSVQRMRARAKTLRGDRFLERAAAEGLGDRLAAVTRKFEDGLWIGPPADIPPEIKSFARNWQAADFEAQEILHAAAPPTEASFDVAVSLLSLQWINDLPGALVQIRRMLKPDGLFLGVLLGGASLQELREAFAQAEIATLGGITPRVAPFADVRDLGSLLQRAGFALPVSDIERLDVRYSDLFGLVRDLRLHGLTNAMSERSAKPLRRATLGALLAHYGEHHGDAGKLKASFELLYLTGWSPHQSQPQPLKPGSAKTRLAAALGTAEHPLKQR
jgi:SAM-dependent methyltransferase